MPEGLGPRALGSGVVGDGAKCPACRAWLAARRFARLTGPWPSSLLRPGVRSHRKRGRGQRSRHRHFRTAPVFAARVQTGRAAMESRSVACWTDPVDTL